MSFSSSGATGGKDSGREGAEEGRATGVFVPLLKWADEAIATVDDPAGIESLAVDVAHAVPEDLLRAAVDDKRLYRLDGRSFPIRYRLARCREDGRMRTCLQVVASPIPFYSTFVFRC